ITEYCETITDSLLHARSLFPGKRNSLDALCDRFGISNAHRTLHGALLDSQLLAEVWLAMTRGQDALLIDVDDNDAG
ncbi:DNA polymerase III subunit epsilon, partial [Salmonella enterica]|nr:DNA polymerase III subunit epsilon [Salmonella enterica]